MSNAIDDRTNKAWQPLDIGLQYSTLTLQWH